MSTSRRTFIKNSAMAMATVAFMPDNFFASKKKPDVLGIQLYSVREGMKNDPEATLRQLTTIGYKDVEHANYIDRKFYGYSAHEFKKVLEGLGLKMKSGHTQMGLEDWDTAKKDFTDKWKYTIEDAAIVGQHYIINPWMDDSLRKDYSTLMRFLELFNKCGELCRKSGLKFGYHNHDFEFNTTLNKKLLYDIILANTESSLVAQQLDVGNMYNGGGRPLDVLKKYPGRFELMHVKDEIKSLHGEMGDGYESTVLGKGILPVKAILDLAIKSGGTSNFIVEQESYQDKTPMECVTDDYNVMKKWGY